MKEAKEITPRSACPVSYTLDFVGDKWMLLILRDMMFEGKSSYGEFLQSDEKIATNILADKLNILYSNGFVTKNVLPENKSKFSYILTEKGIGLLPVVIEMMIWGSRFNPSGGNKDLLAVFKKDKEKAIKEFSKMLKKRIPA
ncbi:helix-turn-helix domain-containing protein [Dyadobacter sp. NIV53]|uniref:winged helix-turn-helix transcriptional regulator n=1 Tax=Dyadobacter sp. NIV53 TaxID=2861765 RepID=UPI001C889189|nr:helix-turn-helix domain-containing protein [Dyadobacter sp. NIV53]